MIDLLQGYIMGNQPLSLSYFDFSGWLNEQISRKEWWMKQNRILKGWFNIIVHSSYFLAWIYILGGMILNI